VAGNRSAVPMTRAVCFGGGQECATNDLLLSGACLFSLLEYIDGVGALRRCAVFGRYFGPGLCLRLAMSLRRPEHPNPSFSFFLRLPTPRLAEGFICPAES